MGDISLPSYPKPQDLSSTRWHSKQGRLKFVEAEAVDDQRRKGRYTSLKETASLSVS